MTRRYTLEEFIEKARKVHGDKYDYSQVDYKQKHSPVKIGCNTCGIVFEQTPHHHEYRKRGCPKCGGSQKLTREEFIEKAITIHGDKYNYDEVEYQNGNTNVTIGCNTCGSVFEQMPSNHTKKTNPSGCPRCGGTQKLTTDEFIEQAREIHGDKYNYDNVHYEGDDKPVKIGCNTCGIFFEQRPTNHKNKKNPSGCPKCGGTQKLTKEEFIEQAREIHGDKYNYDEVGDDYENLTTKVKIRCITCGIVFEQRANNHKNHKQGCPDCNGSQKLTTQEFIEKAITIHGDKYDYDTVKEYKTYKQHVEIRCTTCRNTFKQRPDHHLGGSGCPLCKHKTQRKMYEFLVSNYRIVQTEYSPEFIGRKRFDFYIEVNGLKIIIELDGRQHFEVVKNWGCPNETRENDIIKQNLALENNHSVIRLLQEDVWDDTYNWKTELKQHIESITSSTIIHMDKNDEYIHHKQYSYPLLNECY